MVEGLVAEGAPAEETTNKLMELLLSERYGVAYWAAEELKKRELNERQINHLGNIVHFVPFRGQGSVRVVYYPGFDVSSAHAWEVLAEAKLRRLSLDEQIGWLLSELRYARPFGPSRSDAAANRLEKIGPPAVPALVRKLQRGNSNSQVWASRTLMQIGTSEATSAVEEWSLGILEATDDALIWGAAAGRLGKLKSPKAYDGLVRMLWTHLDESGTWKLIDALADIGDPRARGPLAKILSEHKPNEEHKERVRTYVRAATALVKLGDERGEQALREAAKSPLAELRREVASAVYASLKENGQDILEDLALDQNEAVARAGKSALKRLKPDPPRKPVSEEESLPPPPGGQSEHAPRLAPGGGLGCSRG